MVAVFTGAGQGLFNSSFTQLGGASGGSGGVGQSGERSYVNLATGNLILQDIDEMILTRGLPIGFTRTYNSRGLVTEAGRQTQIGADGWINVFERRISNVTGTASTPGSTVTRTLGDGSEVVYTWDASRAAYVSTVGEGAHDTLTFNGTTQWTWTEGSTLNREIYDVSGTNGGRLLRIIDAKSGAQYNLTYTAAGPTGLVSTVYSSLTNGDGLSFTYTSGRLTRVSTREFNGTTAVTIGQVNYGYDAQGRLITVTTDLTPGGPTADDTWNTTASLNDGKLFRTTYAYVGTSLQIASVVNSDGTKLSVVYDASGRVTHATIGDLNNNDNDGLGQTTAYTYGATDAGTSLTSVTVTDASNRAWTYKFHATTNQLHEVHAPAVNGIIDVTSYTYDTAGNLIQVETRRGATVLARTNYEYDLPSSTSSGGNVVKQWDLLGNRIDRSYNAANQITAETRYTAADTNGPVAGGDPAATTALITRYIYDASNRLRYVINAGQEVTQYVYGTTAGANGQVTTMRRFVGALYTSTTAFLESNLNTWAAAAAQLQKSERTDYLYDVMGRLSEQRVFAQVAQAAATGVVVGDGVLDASTEISRYTYDAQGLLRQRILDRGASRTLGAVSAAGDEVTDYLYDGMGRLLSVLTRDFGTAAMPDRRANLAGYNTWLAANDATTVLTQYLYTDSGNTIAVTTDTGAVRTEVRNVYGQVISVTEAIAAGNTTGQRITNRKYDRAGRLIAEEALIEGTTTKTRSYFLYDAKGQLAAEIDATGAVVEYVRDGADRVTETRRYANRVTPLDAWWTATSPASLWRSDTVGTPPATAVVVSVDASRDRIVQATYDTAGRMSSELVVGVDNTQTQRTTYTYDAAHRLIQTTVGDGANTAATLRTTRYLYDNADRQIATIDALNYVTETVYDLAGRVVKTIRYANASGSPAATALATLRPSTSIKDQITRDFYDGRGNRIGVLNSVGDANSEGYLTEYVYDEGSNQRAVRAYSKTLTGLTGSETFAALKTAANTATTPPTELVRATRRTFNSLGQLITEVNHEGTVTRYTYDEAGRLIGTKTDNESSEIREGTLRYDALGNLIGELTGQGSALLTVGMTEAQLDALYAQYGVRHSYDALGRRTESIDAAGNKTWYYYDGESRQTFVVKGVRDSANVQNAQGEVTETRFDAFGQVIDSLTYSGRIAIAVPGSRSSAEQVVAQLTAIASTQSRVQLAYDRRGLLTQRTDAEGYRSTYAYNAFGEQAIQQDWEFGNGSVRRTFTSTYDKRGQRTTLAEAGGSLNRSQGSTYDAFGRALTRTDARGVVSTASYDRLGRQISQSTDLGSGRIESTSTTYDAYSRMLTQTDAVGKVTTYAYSDSNRTMTITSSEGVVITTAYNRSGQTLVVRQALPGGATAVSSFSYDRDGHVTVQTDALGKTTTNTYDARQLLTTTTDASGRKIEYRYDALGRMLQRIEDPGAGKLNLTTSYAYDGQGRQITMTDASGRVTAMAYDRKGNLIETVRDPGGLALKTSYSWDRDGRQLTMTEGAGTANATTTAYGYDALGRRITETRASGALNLVTTYEYDANDNVTRRLDASGRSTRYSYDAANRLRYTLDGASGLTEVVYDKAGRATMTRTYVKALNTSTLGVAPTEAQIAALITAQTLANDALDAVSYRFYDGDGRVRFEVDGLGNTIQTDYDTAGRLVSTQRLLAPIALSAALRTKLAAGTATAAEIAAAAATNATTAPWSTGFDSTTPAGLDVSLLNPNGNGGGGIQNGRLAFNRVPTANTTHPQVWSQSTYSLSQGLTIRAEITTDSTLNNNVLLFALNGNAPGGLQREGFAIINGQLLKHEYASGVDYNAVIGTVAANTTYIVEIETSASTTTTYIYAKGQSRTSGYSFSRALTQANFGDFKLLMHGELAGIAAGASVFVDNLAILNTTAAVSTSYRYDAAGRVVAMVDGLGNTETYTYDAAGRKLSTTDANGHTSRMVYDAAGREAFEIDALGNTTQTTYDAAGRVVSDHRYLSPIVLTPALLVKLDAGTATASDIASAGAANVTIAPWSTGFDSTTPAGLDVSLLNPNGNGGGGIQNGRLAFNRVPTANTTHPQVWSQSTYSLSQGLTIRAEITTDSTLNNNVLVFALDGNAPGGLQREGFVISDGQLIKHEYASGVDYNAVIGTVAANTTYIVEIETNASTTTTYIYAKGQSRTSGYSFSRALTQANFGDFKLLMHGALEPSAAGAPVFVDNLAILNTTAAVSTSYRYDAAGRVVAMVDGLGNTETYSYDAAGRKLSTTDANGHTSRMVYDAAGRETFAIDALGNTTQTTYDAAGRVVSDHRYLSPIVLTAALLVKLDAGTATASDIASAGAANVTIAPWSTGFESTTPAGLDVSLLDPNGNGGARIQNGRVEFNRIAGALTFPQVWSQGTDTLSQGLSYRAEIKTDTTLANNYLILALRGGVGGNTNDGIHISNGQLYKYESADGPGAFTWLGTLATDTAYVVEIETTATSITTYVYAKGQSRANGYSVTRAATASSFGDFKLLMHGYNEPTTNGGALFVDNLAILNTTAAVSTSYRYDAAGRVVAMVDGLGNTETYTYDAAGRKLSTTDANGHTSRMVYDAAGREVYSIDAIGAYTRNWYDAQGRMVAVRRFSSPFNTATLSDASTVAQLDAQIVWKAEDQGDYRIYDAAGRLRLVYDLTAQVTQIEYDGVGRAVVEHRYTTPFVSSDSTLLGRLFAGAASVADFAAFIAANASTAQSTRTVYDAAGRAVYSIDAIGAFTRNWHDALGRIVAVRKFNATFPLATLSGATTVAQLDAQLGPVGAWSAEYQHEHRVYDAAGRLRITHDAFGQITQTEYDGAGRLTITRRYAVPFSSSDPNLGAKLFAGTATLADFAAFTAANESTARTQSMVYDAADRVRYTLNRDGGVWTVAERQYDGVGRITLQTQFGVTITYTPGQTEAQVIGAIQAQLSNDPAVFVTQFRTTRFVYDAANRQRFVMDATGALSEQRYDGADRVVETRSYSNLPVGIALNESALSAWGQGQASANVRKVTSTYDAAGRMTARTDALNHSETFTYDGIGQMLTRTDRMGAVWTYQYDAAGRRTAEISPATYVFGINAQAGLWAETRSIVTRYFYNVLGQLTRKIEDADNAIVADRRITEYVYDSRGNRIKTILPNPGAIDPVTGNVVYSGANPTIETTYNALGQAVVQKDARGNYSYTAYDALGRVAAEVDQAGHVTTYQYDANAYGEQTRLLRYGSALNTTVSAFTSVGWQAGQAISWTQIVAGVDNNAGSRAIYTAYDSLGRKTQVVETGVQYYTAAGALVWGAPTTQYAYNAYGDVVKASVLLEGTAGQGDAVWANTWRYFDAAGRNTVTVDAEGYVTAMTYNATGEVVKSIEYARTIAAPAAPTATPPALPGAGDPTTGYDRETRWSYDVLGRKVSETVVRNYRNTDGSSALHDYVTTYGYDFEDRLTTLTDNTGSITTTYNALGQSVAVREQARSVLVGNIEDVLYVSTAYDLSSTVASTQRSPYTTLAYDGLGRLIASRRHANGHDGVNPPASDNTRDQVTLGVYDALDRVLMTQSPEGWNTATPTAYRTWSDYDAAGNLTHSWSRLEGSDDSRDAMVHRWYSYDAVGRQTGVSLSRASVASGAQIGLDQSEYAQYNAFGEIVVKTYSNLTGTLQYTYDNAGRMISDNATGATRSYGYNLAGHQVREWHKTWIDASTGAADTLTRTQTDRLGRAIAVTLPSHTADAANTSLVRQRYDRWGNTVQVIDGRGYQTDYQYNDYNQLIRETRPLVWVVSENGAGSWQRPVNEWYYGASGALRGTRDANGNLRTYEYDAVGHQVSSKDALGNVTRMAYDVLGQHRYTQDALGYLTFKDYDLLGRVTAIGDRLTSANGINRDRNVLQSYALNQNGDRIRVTNALGYTAKYDYDSQQRLLRSETSMGVVTNTAYDVMGRKVLETNALTAATATGDRDGSGGYLQNSLSWTYDVFGRMTDHNNLSGRDTDYVYDAQSGMLVSENATGGVGIATGNAIKTISYTRSGRVREVVEAGGGTYRYGYDAAGNRTLEESDATDAYGVRMHTLTRTTYDSNSRVLRVIQDEVDNAGAATKRIFDLGYDYDANGNRRRVVTQSGYGPNVTGISIVNRAPAVVSTPADRTFRSGTSGAFRLLFSDVFRDAENDALTLAITQSNGAALPSWLVATRDAQTGEMVFTGTVPAGAADTDVVVKLTAYETANAGNVISTSFTVRVRGNTTPTASAVSATFNAVVGQSFGRDLPAGTYFTDPDVGDSLSLSVVGAVPAWLTVNTSAPGLVRLGGTPPAAGSYAFTLRATDSRGGLVDRVITVNAAVNAPPTVVAAPAQVNARISQSFLWNKPLSQLFTDSNGDALQVTAVGMPSWMSVQTIGGAVPELRLSGPVPLNEVDNRLYTITFTATDPSGAWVSTTLTVKVVQNNVAPVAPTVPPLPPAKVGVAYHHVLPAFTDSDGDALTYTIGYLPPGLSFDAATRTISGTPTSAAVLNLSYSASDGLASAWTSLAFTVLANTLPTGPTVGNQVVTPGTVVNLTLPAFTDADGDTLSYSVSNLPTGLSFNASTRQITGTASTEGSWGVTYTVEDGRGGVVSRSFVFAVAAPGVNQPPVLTAALVDQDGLGGEEFNYTFAANSFTDPEGLGLSYSFSIVSVVGTGGSVWLKFDPSQRRFWGTPFINAEQTLTVRVTATDSIGQQVFDTFTIRTESGNTGDAVTPTEEAALSFEMGAASQTELLMATSASASAVGVQIKDEWFTYDAENRIKVSAGVLSGAAGAAQTQILINALNADSHEVLYDAQDRVIGRFEQRGSYARMYRTTYDERGRKRYEYYADAISGQAATSGGIARAFTYDAADQLIETRSYYSMDTQYDLGLDSEGVPQGFFRAGGMLKGAEQLQYDRDGRVLGQYTRSRFDAQWWRGLGEAQLSAQYTDLSLLWVTSRVNYTQSDGSNAWEDNDPSNNASGYDALGRLQTYRYSAIGSGGNYTHTFTSTYEGWESWQEKTVAGISSNSTYKPTTNTLTLDAYGRITQQREHTEYQSGAIDDRVRVYSYTGDGAVQTRREGTVNSSNVFTQSTGGANNTPQNFQFVHAAGQQLAELRAGGEVRAAAPTQRRGGSRFTQIFNAAQTPSQPQQTNTLSSIGSSAGSGAYTAGGGTVAVQQGETLQSLAQRIYGSSTLWYVLADANGYSDPSAELTAGVQLKTPSVGVNSNDANTFKPYNPNEAIGSTSPTLPFIPPPPKQGCNTLALILIVIVVIAVSVATWGAASGAATAGANAALASASASAAATGTTLAAGTAVSTGLATATVGAATSLTVGGGILVGAAAGAAGALAGQVVGSALGVSSFSWRNVAAGAITGAITGGLGAAGGLGGVSGAVASGNYGAAAALAVGNAAGGYAGQKIAGLKPSFSWRSIAASAVASVVSAGISKAAGLAPNKPFEGAGSFGADFGNEAIEGVVSLHTRRAFGFNDKVDYGTIAANAFGTAAGNALGREFNAARAASATARRNNNLKSSTDSDGSYTLYDVTANDPFAARQIQDYANESIGGTLSEYGYNATLAGTDATRLSNMAADRPSSTAVRFGGTPRRSSDLSWLQSAMEDYAQYGADFDINSDGQRDAYDRIIVTGLKDGQPGFSGTGDGYLRYLSANNRPAFQAANQLFGRGNYNRWAGQYGYQSVEWTASAQRETEIRQGNAGHYNMQLKAYLNRAYEGRTNSTPYALQAYDAGAQQRADLTALVNVPVGVAKELGNGVAALVQISSPFFGMHASWTGNYDTWEPFTANNPAQQLGQMLSIPVGMVVAPEAILLKAATAAPRTYTGLRTVKAWEEVGVPAANSRPLMNLADDFTATTYRSGTRNYQIHDPSPDGFGHGLMANVTTDGQMTFTIRANPELRAQYGSGGDMFDSLMLRLKNDDVAVNSIKGEWHVGTDSVNAGQFMAARSAGLSAENAAFSTWTGRMAQRYGFIDVVVPESTAGVIRPIFSKPVKR